MTLKADGPALKQPIFNCKSMDKYQELGNFEIEVKNIMINSCNTQDNEKFPIIQTGLAEKDYTSYKQLKDDKQEKGKTRSIIFEVLREKNQATTE